MRSDIARLPIAILPVLAAGCASSPLETPEAVEIAAEPPLPRAILVKVRCDREDLFGSRAEWCSAVAEAFRELKVGAAVWTEDEISPDAADLVVDLRIDKNETPRDPEIQGQSALLTTLAWSSIPFLPWFLHDVHHDPGFIATVNVGAASENGWSPMIPSPEKKRTVAAVPTSLRERYPILSWSTLAVIAVPPFTFQGGDRERVIQAIAPRARANVALDLAGLVKGAQLQSRKELLGDLSLELSGASCSLHYEPAGDLGKISVRIEPLDPRIPWPEGMFKETIIPYPPVDKVLPLGDLPSPLPAPGLLLRIEAFGRRGARARYSLAIPSGPAGEAPGNEEA
jgi:hypothetical protein